MKHKRLWMVALSILILVTVIGVTYHKTGKKNKTPEFVFLYAENQPDGYPTTLGAEHFASLVEERTGGEIQILIKSGGELGVEKDVIQQLSYGGIDFARISLSQLAEKIPEMNVLQLPYLYEDSEHMWRVLDGELGERFLALTQTQDLIGLSWYDAGARSFYSASKPITCLADVNGMRIRVQESELMADMITAMGGTPVKIDYDAVYESIERGIVDGAENNWSSYMYMKHNEVAGYFTVDEHTRVPELQLCSAHTWSKLSSSQQEIILECAKESALYERKLWIEQENVCKEAATKQGVEVISLTAEQKKEFQAAMEAVYEKYSGDFAELVEEVHKYQER